MNIRLGVDFDNTIISYDGVFHRVAVERGLIPETVGCAKGEVRDWLRAGNREDDWTGLQGFVYGQMVPRCEPYAGVLAFFRAARAAGIKVFIVSHKTRYPYVGPKYDLHEAARAFITGQRMHELDLAKDRVFFEITKMDKLARIAMLGCTHFIDDLPEFLAEKTFPHGVQRILFDPACLHEDETRFIRICHWNELPAAIGVSNLTVEGG